MTSNEHQVTRFRFFCPPHRAPGGAPPSATAPRDIWYLTKRKIEFHLTLRVTLTHFELINIKFEFLARIPYLMIRVYVLFLHCISGQNLVFVVLAPSVVCGSHYLMTRTNLV